MKIEDVLGVVKTTNVVFNEVKYNDVYDTVKVTLNSEIDAIRYDENNNVDVVKTNSINFTEKQFVYIMNELFENELTIIDDMFFEGKMSAKTMCTFLKGMKVTIDSTLVTVENGTMPYRIQRNFSNGVLNKDNVRKQIKFVKDLMD